MAEESPSTVGLLGVGMSVPQMPIADILSASISGHCAVCGGSFRRSSTTPLSNIRISPRSELFGFLRRVLTVPPCGPCSSCSRQIRLDTNQR